MFGMFKQKVYCVYVKIDKWVDKYVMYCYGKGKVMVELLLDCVFWLYCVNQCDLLVGEVQCVCCECCFEVVNG